MDITANWHPSVAEASPGATLLVHDPVQEDRIPERCQVLGQRTLNRRQRLILAEQSGLPVPRWRSLERKGQIVPLLDEWGVDHVLYKADYSYMRKGIRLVTRGRVPDDIVNADADVFMAIVEGSPHTLKIDLFFDEIIACRKTFTRSVFDPKFRKSFTEFSSLGKIPPLLPQLRALGRALLYHGVGLTGVDVMIDREDEPWVIELNTCSVGREATWRRWPDLYIGGYVAGICRWVREDCPGRYSNNVAPVTGQLSQRFGGEDVTRAT